ncbi:FecR family protein [Mucilaginibacter sp.]|jgi:ferric-dicitrate binding protein FerR (iron transport regulator)|uniref:FecR family protein n=1 Tax=Mucilaginibacter sp. TaxID=1882438 RepID=UPI003566C832
MQPVSNEKIKELADKWLKGTITADERAVFNNWYNEKPLERLTWPALISDEDLKDKLFANIIDAQKKSSNFKVVHFYRPLAAVLTLFIGLAVFYSFFNQKQKQLLIKKAGKMQNDYSANNTHQVILTLADGSKMALSKLSKSTVARYGNTLIKEDANGAYIYYNVTPATQTKALSQMNSISTPSGEQYQIKLPDGTKVWLNALSSLKFPSAFSAKSRHVELIGEAYFEVAKNKNKPFIVNMPKGISVQVLGTHFDVMAYQDESNINTTLIEGSVKVQKGHVSKLIVPGEQAAINNSIENNSIEVANVDVQQVIAWKNELFSFDGSGTHEIMRQIGRWYGVKIIYSANTHDHQFTGYISRKSKLTDVLKMLELSGVNFLIKDNVIEVLN